MPLLAEIKHEDPETQMNERIPKRNQLENNSGKKISHAQLTQIATKHECQSRQEPTFDIADQRKW